MREEETYDLPENPDDLSLHAPLLAQLKGRSEGFVVPEETGHVSPELAMSGKETEWPVPQGYFAELPDLMLSRIAIEHPEGKDENVPEGYFENFNDEINSFIALDNLKQDDGLQVPQGYFESLASQLEAKLNLIERSDENTVPKGYFEELPQRIEKRIAEEEQSQVKVVSLQEIWISVRRPVAIAATAVFLAGIAWILYQRINNSRTPEEAPVANLTKPVPAEQPVIPVPDTMNVAVPAVPQEAPSIAQAEKKIPQQKKSRPEENRSAPLAEEDILAHSEILDESMLTEFIAEQELSSAEGSNEDVMDYLLNNNMNLDLIDPGN